MSFAHLTLPTRDVERTAAFFESTFGWRRNSVPGNIPVETVWFDIGRGQEIHVFFVEGFDVSPFEAEFGRHIALFRPLAEFADLRARLLVRGVTMLPEVRTAPYERFFFREPVNGYVFEVIDEAKTPKAV
jgi:catechol 2,3-dioxygenase-like lactoylglutathione lyase family enzyme